MPYARVGALPQPQHDTQPSQKGKMGKPQGITMEDLKKQTALRLSQEPGQPEFTKRNPNERSMLQVHDLKRQTAIRLAQEQEQSRLPSSMEGPMQILPPDQGQMQFYGVPQAFAPVDPNRVAQDSRMFNARSEENRSFSRYEGQRMVDVNRNKPMQYVPIRSNSTTAPNQPVAEQVRNTRVTRPGSSLSAGSANSYGSSSTERKGKSKPKLPHGLTVQELKEMTKARLQAEASDGSMEPENKNVAFQQQPSFGRGAGDAVSPLGFVHEPKPIGTPTGGFHGRISPHTPNGSMMREGYQIATPQSRDLWPQTNGFDGGWDTASVASTSNSEYLGSEAGLSPSFQQQQDDSIGVPFSRSRSYGGGYEQAEPRSPFFAANGPFADLSSGQNRRRASTLSPRPGPGLTYLHEDRPLGDSASNVRFPASKSAIKPRPRVRTINSDIGAVASEPSPYTDSSSPTHLWASPSGGVIGESWSNRPRTASAPTVRSVSQPSEEFLHGRNPLVRPPSTHSLGLGGDFSNTAFDDAMGLSTGGGESGGQDDFSSVFRQPASVPRPPPGLFPSSEPPVPPSRTLNGCRSNDSGWSDAWNQLAPHHQEYHPRERSHTDGEALLADSLGSMLNISSGRQPSIGQNTFVSRIDPEIDYNRRRAVTSSPVSPSQRSYEAFTSPNGGLFERTGSFGGDKSGFM